jgi:hypothetical protein
MAMELEVWSAWDRTSIESLRVVDGCESVSPISIIIRLACIGSSWEQILAVPGPKLFHRFNRSRYV